MPDYARPSTFRLVGPNAKKVYTEQWSGTYSNSPRVNGVLVLRSNPCNLRHWRLTGYSETPSTYGYYSSGGGADSGYTPPQGFTPSDNQAYNRWRGKLHKGGASLGVTLGSWKQSRRMITDRCRKLGDHLDYALKRLNSNDVLRHRVERKKRSRELLADDILETKFGWKPLFEDLHASLFTVCKDGVPPEWVRGSGRSIQKSLYFSNSGQVRYTSECNFVVTTTYGAKVAISNPNLWLLNRLGLINPATVAWDLIPWSFVVQMFVNVNSLIESVTDTVGLDVTEHSITRSWKNLQQDLQVGTAGVYSGMVYKANQFVVSKTRTLGTPLKPVLALTVPELNWDLAVTAASLAVQKFKRINRLLGI